jgi:hypothetical protein
MLATYSTRSPFVAAILVLCLESAGHPAVWFVEHSTGDCLVTTLASHGALDEACRAAEDIHSLARE